jgi:hypothetical protein
MNMDKLVFAQIMEHLPRTTFGRCVARYGGEHKVKTFSCLDQYLCMPFAQLTYRESLRDSEACLRAQEGKLYHMGIRGSIARNTLANAKRGARLARLRRFGPIAHWHRSPALCRGSLWCRSERDGLRVASKN